MADIQSAAAEIRRGKERKKKNKPQHENIMVSLLHRATIKNQFGGRKVVGQAAVLARLAPKVGGQQ